MTRARKTLIALDATSYFHICVRTVRDGYLCGYDRSTGRNFDHRKQWLEDELLRLGQIFAIDISAYAIMSNHYHVVLHVDKVRASRWRAAEVVERWHRLFKGTEQSQAFAKGEVLEGAARMMLDGQISTWLQRLMDISWFMRVINEKIARRANAEDGCSGRFWQGRFKSRALLDEKALISCLAYVDLNPIRAKLARTPENSEHTSIKRRIEALGPNPHVPFSLYSGRQAIGLQKFFEESRQDQSDVLPFRMQDYIELVDWTGRQIREDKRGFIEGELPPILDRLTIEPEHWLYMTRNYHSAFKSLVGSVIKVRAACKKLGWKKSHSLSMCKLLLG